MTWVHSKLAGQADRVAKLVPDASQRVNRPLLLGE